MIYTHESLRRRPGEISESIIIWGKLASQKWAQEIIDLDFNSGDRTTSPIKLRIDGAEQAEYMASWCNDSILKL